jgi:putative aminopeptidase FrvX
VGPAGVIAGVVFEDTIRRACTKYSIVEKGVQLELLIDQLSKAAQVPSVKTKRAKAAAGVRTKATHAQWDEFDKDDVEATIATTRAFVNLLLA